MNHYLIFALGMFVGNMLGFTIAAILAAASDADDRMGVEAATAAYMLSGDYREGK